MAFLCPARMRRKKQKGVPPRDVLEPPRLEGRVTGSDSIDTLVRVGLEKESAAPKARMVVVHDFHPCVDDELAVTRGQHVQVLYQENDWLYVVTAAGSEGFIPFNYCLPVERSVDDFVVLPRSRQEYLTQSGYKVTEGHVIQHRGPLQANNNNHLPEKLPKEDSLRANHRDKVATVQQAKPLTNNTSQNPPPSYNNHSNHHSSHRPTGNNPTSLPNKGQPLLKLQQIHLQQRNERIQQEEIAKQKLSHSVDTARSGSSLVRTSSKSLPDIAAAAATSSQYNARPSRFDFDSKRNQNANNDVRVRSKSHERTPQWVQGYSRNNDAYNKNNNLRLDRSFDQTFNPSSQKKVVPNHSATVASKSAPTSPRSSRNLDNDHDYYNIGPDVLRSLQSHASSSKSPEIIHQSAKSDNNLYTNMDKLKQSTGNNPKDYRHSNQNPPAYQPYDPWKRSDYARASSKSQPGSNYSYTDDNYSQRNNYNSSTLPRNSNHHRPQFQRAHSLNIPDTKSSNYYNLLPETRVQHQRQNSLPQANTASFDQRDVFYQTFHKTSFGKYIVLYNYSPRQENDLSVQRGEFVLVLNKDDPEWFWVRRSDQQEGFVPTNFICPAEGQNVTEIRSQSGHSNGQPLRSSQPARNSQRSQEQPWSNEQRPETITSSSRGHQPPSSQTTLQQQSSQTNNVQQNQHLRSQTQHDVGVSHNNRLSTHNNNRQSSHNNGPISNNNRLSAHNTGLSSHNNGQSSHHNPWSQQPAPGSQRLPTSSVPPPGTDSPSPRRPTGGPRNRDLNLERATRLVCLYDYQGAAPGDLSVARGQWLYADLTTQGQGHDDDPEWLWVFSPLSKKAGFIPRTYAKPPNFGSFSGTAGP